MTKDAVRIVWKIDPMNIEQQLALQCAPLLAGLKISNLFILPDICGNSVGLIFQNIGISYYRLLEAGGRLVFLLFCRKELEKLIAEEEVRSSLVKEGYQNLWLGGVLRTFQMRYQAYADGKKAFPHEMGLLLGYPLEDVRGFIKNKGKNFLYSGYWKVYKDAEEKRILFQKFEHAREALLQLLSKGVCLEELLGRKPEGKDCFNGSKQACGTEVRK